jgi:hypothetical protein
MDLQKVMKSFSVSSIPLESTAIFHMETSTLFVKLAVDSNGIEETENDFITFCKSIHLIEGDL